LTGVLGLTAMGLMAATAPAVARDNEGGGGSALTATIFATGGTGTPPRSNPDDITAMGGSIFVAWQNGVGPAGEPAASGNTESTVVEYSRTGREIANWNLTGRVDGMTADAARERIIATVNEDDNTSLYTIRPDAPGGSQLTHYTYSPSPPPHGGGTDAPHIYRGQLLISASSPKDTTQPAVYRATLSGTTATLWPVVCDAANPNLFCDNSWATVANTNSPAYGQRQQLMLTDPDSNTVVPGSSPRFRGDFMLDAQGDQQQVYARNVDSPNQQLFVLNLSQPVDDTAWATASRGTLYVTDGSHVVWALSGGFKVGTAYSAVTPGNANTPVPCNPPNPAPCPNYLATLNLNTGVLTPVPGQTVTAKGLVFVSGSGSGGNDQGNNGDGNDGGE
jgi:hypothetical protein